MFLERRRVEEMMNLCVYNMYVTYVKEGIKLTSNVHEMNDDEMISSLNLVIYNICIRVDTVHRCKVILSIFFLFTFQFILFFTYHSKTILDVLFLHILLFTVSVFSLLSFRYYIYCCWNVSVAAD